MMITVYGLGGYNPDHPNGNVAEVLIDHGDGTGTDIYYDADGVETHRVARTDLPIPQSHHERINQWLDQQDDEASAALIAVMSALVDTARTLSLSTDEIVERISALLLIPPEAFGALSDGNQGSAGP